MDDFYIAPIMLHQRYIEWSNFHENLALRLRLNEFLSWFIKNEINVSFT